MSSPEVQQIWTRTDVYHNSFLLPDDQVLANIEENSKANHMLEIAVTPAQGKFLHLLARSIGAKKILEIGTLGGLVYLPPPDKAVPPIFLADLYLQIFNHLARPRRPRRRNRHHSRHRPPLRRGRN
jgi:hypothetical protein